MNELEKLKQELQIKEKIILEKDKISIKQENIISEPKEKRNQDKPNSLDFDTFRTSSKLFKSFNGHKTNVYCIDYLTFGDSQFICSGAEDKTIRVWDIETTEQIQIFTGHSDDVSCVKFSSYHYCNQHSTVICSASSDKTICFWDIKNDKSFQIFNGHTDGVYGIELSSFNGGRYLCSGSHDNTVGLWDIETSRSLHIFNEHTNWVWCVDISPLQNNDNNNDNKNNSIGVIGGNGYTICSGSLDRTIRIWDIETTKQLIVFKGHEYAVRSVKYGSNELINTILSGSWDTSMRLWDIRSGQQIQVFNGHTREVNAVAYSPLVNGNGNMICSGSWDNTIRFCDIRSNKELHVIKGDDVKDDGILCFKFLGLKEEKVKKNERTENGSCSLCYGSSKGIIRIWE
ncbi:G-protein beta WD-40 repeats containing protein [Reticulomyxa filosa]|uniref:G-protein beta WD-40 repeats containing protein n=1 Tax=Reticulomyxa filosa TaxID=46433 RepID=X6MRK7_RETFI|nr:G-protein beta WD-40 repeats containing protein [Reticulomyxa filosa]|eukprot:ETO16653.1 G-protein beta WD-40 repeats containing protein [Reticulomyxa filosa]